MADSNESSKTQKKLDTISRQAAIDVLDTGLWGVEWDKALATAMLKDLPTAEPQIIRCNDCKYWDFSDIHSSICPNRRCKATIGKMYTDADFYCAYAERRQDVSCTGMKGEQE